MQVDPGRVGVWLTGFVGLAAEQSIEAVQEIEELGYGAAWYPEAFGTKECFSAGGLLLGATSRIVIGTGIANIWARNAVAMANGARTLGEAYPGRFLLGLGVSHVEQVGPHGLPYSKPISTMRTYLDDMEGAPFFAREPEPSVPIVLAALRPKMLELAAERTEGAHPYFVPVEHTVRSREVMGADKFLAPEQAVVLSSDPAAAREIARAHASFYLGLENYRKNLLWLGYDESELVEGGSDRLVDDVVAMGSVDVIAERVRAHLDAGADHVCIQPLIAEEDRFPLAELRELSAALLEL